MSTRTLISPAQLARPRGKRLYWATFALVVTVFTVVFPGLMYWMVSSGFKDTQEAVATPPTLIPESFQPDNYSQAWNVMDLAGLLGNTLYYAFGALAFQLVLDVAAAYSLSKLRPVLGKAILGMMLATLMIPATVLVVPQYLTVLDVPIFERNLLNTPWAIWLPSVTNAFNIFLLHIAPRQRAARRGRPVAAGHGGMAARLGARRSAPRSAGPPRLDRRARRSRRCRRRTPAGEAESGQEGVGGGDACGSDRGGAGCAPVRVPSSAGAGRCGGLCAR
ncbi:carbohydrate ABC transporter permease [Streptomyces mutabilis]|uniref:carbohydrate ABC transporter permease n=1 Tax=Streptomyces mutabilis TaxID=67332 RepID=UPI000B070EB3|nr:hypothetical protein [Streptomyces mutabilis]